MDLIDLWLDDVRPAPDGWLHVKTVNEAKAAIVRGNVRAASLDHDLGACPACMGGKTLADWIASSSFLSMPHCPHVGTGYDLCLWMAQSGHWPIEKPTVHSANPVGARSMRGVIDRYGPYDTAVVRT